MSPETALQLAATAWCKEKTGGKDMDPDLAAEFANILVGVTRRPTPSPLAAAAPPSSPEIPDSSPEAPDPSPASGSQGVEGHEGENTSDDALLIQHDRILRDLSGRAVHDAAMINALRAKVESLEVELEAQKAGYAAGLETERSMHRTRVQQLKAKLRALEGVAREVVDNSTLGTVATEYAQRMGCTMSQVPAKLMRALEKAARESVIGEIRSAYLDWLDLVGYEDEPSVEYAFAGGWRARRDVTAKGEPQEAPGMREDVRYGLRLILRSYIYTTDGVIGAAKKWIEDTLRATEGAVFSPAMMQGLREIDAQAIAAARENDAQEWSERERVRHLHTLVDIMAECRIAIEGRDPPKRWFAIRIQEIIRASRRWGAA